MDQDRRKNRGNTSVKERPPQRRRRSPDRRSEQPPRRREPIATQPREQAATQPRRRRSIRRAEPLPEEIPEVVYTPARPFRAGRFAMQLATTVIVVLALVFGVSLFFRAQTVTVAGAVKYSPAMVAEASGIQTGDSLFPLNEARISGRIISALPYVKNVRVGVRLPDTVKIEIEEMPVAYAIEARDGTWWLMGADGKLVEAISQAQAADYTRIKGVRITLPVIGEQAVAAEAAQTVIGEETVVVATTGAQRLEIALSVLQAMEQAGFLGNMDSVDVTDASNLVVWSGAERFRLLLGDKSRLDYKLGCAGAAMEQLAAYESGVLDVSLTGTDNVVFTPAG